jgi:hypothetical protein
VIYVTSEAGSDVGAPLVTAVPRSQWDRYPFFYSEETRDTLSMFFGRDCFDAAKHFFVFYAPEHTARW